MSIESELRAEFGDAVLGGTPPEYLTDFTRAPGTADAVVLPATAEEVAAVLAWCYERDVPVVPRGGGTGAAAGAVPDGGVVVALDRLDRVRSFEPELWRINVEAGVPTGRLKQLVRESGLMFAPDPGAPEQSQIGGNIATNAGGPHAFKYGVVGDWVTGIEAALPPGELVSVGGAIRKDVAGYDLKRLLVGSEGTLGIVTAAWLKLMPAPEAVLPVAVFHRGTPEGCAALLRVVGSGIVAAALDVLDAETLACGAASFPGGVPDGAGFVLLAEADGSLAEAERIRDELVEAAGEDAVGVHAPRTRDEVEAFWRWRSGLAFAVLARRGGVVAEDIVVPLDRVEEAMEETLAIGRRRDLVGLSFGHAGDGNLHSAFLVAPQDPDELRRAALAVDDLFDVAVRLGGSVSGEHGLGLLKRGQLARQWSPRALDLHADIKRLFDPKDLLNPGKKLARPPAGETHAPLATRS
ncbi:MAG TPA: FAD-linked oxidase C-terminal domain-containing protein [Gaiellaceae bacterium]|nr:FAD-linked oxidase C-terminal domain-containing protein [Gaiellaceae bacterium]